MHIGVVVARKVGTAWSNARCSNRCSCDSPSTPARAFLSSINSNALELELELIQTQMAQKPMLRAEVGMRVRCANKASAE